jgi:hypothetical protein
MKFLAILLAAAAVVSGLVIERADAPDPKQVYIKEIKWKGSGCPKDTVDKSISPDGKTVTLLFSQYTASIGPKAALVTDAYKNCILFIRLRIPQGWAYTVHQTQYWGYYDIDAGVSAVQKSIYHFEGDNGDFSAQTTFKGKAFGDYHFTDTIKKETLLYCRCGADQALNINTSLRMQSIDPKKYGGFITNDQTEHTVKHILGIQWRRC